MTTSTQTSLGLGKSVAGERRYFTLMALVMVAISIAGFFPAIVDPASRRAPLTPLAGTHGAVCFAYIVLFLVQARLVATGRVALHRRLGLAGVVLLAAIIPLSYVTTIGMVHRGFDLSGDQGVDSKAHGALDAEYGAVFNLFALTLFAVLAAAGLALRRRSEIHKRLMLYANIELMGSPVTHFWGHTGAFNHVSVPVGAMLVLAPMAILMLSCVVRDYVLMRRVRPLTAVLAIVLFGSLPIQAGVIGPSAWWHCFVDWLAR